MKRSSALSFDTTALQLTEALRRGDAKVDCGSCRLCCFHQRVIVLDGDPVERYDTEDIGNGTRMLRQRPDGSCIHLGPGGCEVYEHRPRICRAFDCGAWFRSIPRGERRQMARQDKDVAQLIARGREMSARTVR